MMASDDRGWNIGFVNARLLGEEALRETGV